MAAILAAGTTVVPNYRRRPSRSRISEGTYSGSAPPSAGVA
jgi:hypothetical protein